MRVLIASLVLACFVTLACAQSPPVFPDNIYIAGIVRLPYAGIIEPFEQWINGGSARVDFYNGLDVYVYRSDLNMTWQVNPLIDTPTCFATPGPVTINSYLPNTAGFVLQPDAVQVEDQMCDDYQLTVNTLGKVSVYDLYMSRTTGQVVRYQMMGYDSLIGSHFDLYQIDYNNITVMSEFPVGLFNEPANQCGNFPGPGASMAHMNPMTEFNRYYPSYTQAGEVSDHYAEYMKKHGKAYPTSAEKREREMYYQRNLHFIESHQRRYRIGRETYTVGLNFLADHTPSEMLARRGKLRSKKGASNAAPGGYHLRNYYDADLPTSVDWRQKGAVNKPQDQGICGSCWSFGSTGAIEGAYFLKYGILKVMAEQQLMDCSWNYGNNACDGGEDFRAYEWIIQNGGMAFKENYGPYLMQDSYCKVGQASDVVISSYVNVTEFDENALLDALASVGPISISIDASHPGLSFYTGGVYYDPACGNGLDDLDHSVSAVGYGTDPSGGDYWIVKNSWSTYWGDGGYIKMSRKNNNCGVATMPTYVIVE